ncbi:MAG: FAD-binding protein [Thaumarchaeota archaeon]|nr:FAD-binding protein [Nitrososphaerota archaeon]
MNLPCDEIVDTDVVIVGAESTGTTAAKVCSTDPNIRIAILTKGPEVGKVGATMLAHEPLSSCVIDSKSAHEVIGLKQGDLRDGPDAFLEDIVMAGDYMSDQRLAQIVVTEAPKVAKEITDWGFEWNYDVVDRSPGHRFPRDYYGKRGWGPQYLRLMASLIRDKPNVAFHTETMALDLVVSEGRLAGVTAVDMKTGAFVLFRCRAVILAAGGAQNVYPHVTTGRELTGDAYAAAFRAGAELMDMEFVKFNMAIVWPEGAANDPFALLQTFRHTSRWYNRLGQRFMEKWDPVNMERNTEVGKIAVATEILEGRGGKHGIYYSIRHLPKNLIDYQKEWSRLRGWVDASTHYDYSPYVEMMKDGVALEVTLACHYNEGGIRIDEKCATSIPGVFAAGETSAGVDGGRRIAGMALTTAFVQGFVAAEESLDYLTKASRQEVDPRRLEAVRQVWYAPAKNDAGVSPVEVRKRIQDVAQKYAWVVRNRQGLQTALEEVTRIRGDLDKMCLQTKGLNYNLEFIESLQVRNILDCLEMTATSALVREESRGVHYRSDFPMMNNDSWMKNVVLSRGENGRIIVNKIPVVSTKLALPNGVKKFGEYITRIDGFKGQ